MEYKGVSEYMYILKTSISNSMIFNISHHGVTNKKVIIYPFYSKINKWDKYDELFTNMLSQFLIYVVCFF